MAGLFVCVERVETRAEAGRSFGPLDRQTFCRRTQITPTKVYEPAELVNETKRRGRNNALLATWTLRGRERRNPAGRGMTEWQTDGMTATEAP